MAVAPAPFFTEDFTTDLDGLLYTVAEELQLAPSRYDKAVERYNAVNRYLEAEASPFNPYRPTIYPQGSMALNTTVKPVEGPHDLDFVLELALAYHDVDPMKLIRGLYEYLRESEVYKAMISLKNRCVRVEYADDFYMDILPACENPDLPGTCIMVPDRQVKDFKHSNPKGFIAWFRKRSEIALPIQEQRVLAKADPIPDQQSVTEKLPLQIDVQLLKRWRDLLYVDTQLGPISIVLTTLAANHNRGELSASKALLTILSGIVAEIDEADRRGVRVKVCNPSNLEEDLSERWDSDPQAYIAFKSGIRGLAKEWRQLMTQQGNVSKELERLFGEPVKTAFRKRAERLQEQRTNNKLGVTGTGLIVPASATVPAVRPNTFYGEEK